MSSDTTPPQAQAFVVCRQIFEHPQSRDFALIAPLNRVRLTEFPAKHSVSIYVYLTGGHHSYQMDLHLHDQEDREVWSWCDSIPVIDLSNPLQPGELVLYDVILEFPEPGRYDLLLRANGEEVARHVLWVEHAD